MIKIDLYTKVVLTVIAVALVVLILKPLCTFSTASALGNEQFSYIQPMGRSSFFDARTGDIYYYAPPSGEELTPLSLHYRLEEVGRPLRRIK